MSTYTSRKQEALRNRLSYAKLLSTSALTAAGLIALGASGAQAGNVEANEVWQFENGTDVNETFLDDGHVQFSDTGSGRIIGNLVKEDICATCQVDLNADLTVATGIESGTMKILGKLTSTGDVYVFDVNGFLFGSGSQVDVAGNAGFIGGTYNRMEEKANGDISFDIDVAEDASITIEDGAMISVGDAGLAAFVAPTVVNGGIINAKMGTVEFAAGKTATLDLYGDGLVELAVEGELSDALLEVGVGGEIRAEGGNVHLTALAAKDAVDNIINVEGVVTVASAEVQGGKIVLSGGSKGNVNVAGTLDASGTDGGSISVTGENITVAETAELYADGGKGADQKGDGGRIDVIANRHLDFRGLLRARGGALGGHGGFAETSGYEFLGYSGNADLSAANGDMGTLLLDPEFAVVHSGALHNPLGQGYVLAAWALANSMENANVVVQADEFIDVGTRNDTYDTGNSTVDAILNALVGTGDVDLSTYDYATLNTPPPGCGAVCQFFWGLDPNNYTQHTGTTTGSITFDSDTVNFNKDVIMGDGNIGVDAMTVNLDSRLYDKDGTTALGDARIFSNADTVNVISNDALIQQGVWFSTNNGTLNVGSGEYNESVNLNRRGLKVNGANAGTAGYDTRPNDETIVTGNSPAFTVNADNITIDGFTMDGPGLTYGVLLNDVKGTKIKNNIISNSSVAGIGGVIDHHPGTGTLLIENNLIDGSNTGDGIALAGDSAGKDGTQSLVGVDIDILNNQIGEDGDRIGGKGITFTKVGDLGDTIENAGTTNVTANIEIDGNDVYSTGNAVEFGGSVADATINITNNNDGFDSLEDGVVFKGVISDSVVNLTNNIIHAAGVGVSFLADLKDGSTISLTDNTIGTDGNEVLNGILFEDVRDAIVNISGGSIDAGGGSGSIEGDGINFTKGTRSGADVNISDVEIVSDGDEAIDFHQAVRSGSTVDIEGGSYTGGNNGIEFSGTVAGEVRISDATIDGQGSDKRGINLLGSITNLLKITNSTITGGDDGIGSNDNQNNTVNGGTLIVSGSTITGINGDGIELGALKNNANVDIFNNDSISGGNNGINVAGDITDSDLDIAYNDLIEGKDGDGVVIAGDVDNSDVGVGLLIDLTPSSLTFWGGNTIKGSESGVVFKGEIKNGSRVDVSANTSISGENGDGVRFEKDITDSTVAAGGNLEILGKAGDGIAFRGKVENSDVVIGTYEYPSDILPDVQITLIGNPKIQGSDDGIDFAGDITNSTVDIIDSDITGTNSDGIDFNGGINGGSKVSIAKNTIFGGNDGVDFEGAIAGATTTVMVGGASSADANTITGAQDGLDVGPINDATFSVSHNTKIEGQTGDAIEFEGEVFNNATVNITNNDNLIGGDNGINFLSNVTNSVVNILNNNHGIHADNHGILFGGNVWYGSTINIHDNIISANEDGGSIGDGIHFGGDVYTADINIGDGRGPSTYDDPSNIITGRDGIHFDGKVTNGADIEIDGNRIGYKKGEKSGIIYASEVSDDGIQFIGDISGEANIRITDNRINSRDDGVSFIGDVKGDARIQIGDYRDANKIYSRRGDGIQFEGDIKEHSLIAITDNDIDAYKNGIVFNGETSNHIHGSGHPAEILIAYNDIVGGLNGISFEGFASHGLHDIMIMNNDRVIGQYGDGIRHTGSIKDAELYILNNEKVTGYYDGIHVSGYFYDGAKIKIAGNGWGEDGGVRGVYDDGIHVQDYGYDTGADVDVVGNHVHHTGDDGIFVKNIEDVVIAWNEVHNTGGHGIYGSNVDSGYIGHNDIWDTDEHGIKVNPSDYVDIAFNTIHYAGWDGIRVDDGIYADIYGNHVHYVGDDGIDVNGNYGVDIYGNTVKDTGLAWWSYDGDGIEVSESYDAYIGWNTVKRAGDDGIDLESSSYADIRNNQVFLSGDDGIDAEYAYMVDINDNIILGAYDDGIEVRSSYGADVKRNAIGLVGDDGIDVEDSSYADIEKNFIRYAYDNGIEVSGGEDVDIIRNNIKFVGGDGINVRHVHGYDPDHWDVTIRGNKIRRAGDDGIDVRYSGNTRIKNNKVRNVEDDGIVVVDPRGYEYYGDTKTRGIYDGDYGYSSAKVNIVNNKVKNAGDDGVEVRAHSVELLVDKNEIKNSGDNGILLIAKGRPVFDDVPSEETVSFVTRGGKGFGDGEFNSVITNNDVSDSGSRGLYVKGATHDNVEVTGNVFTDNPVHAEFESGLIDLTQINPETGFGNEFFGGRVGLYFSPWEGEASLLSLVDDDAPGFQTFQSTGGGQPTNYGGTIGEQFFDGTQSAGPGEEGPFFVQLDNNAFTTPGGQNIWLNGLNSTYVLPPGLGGELRPADTGGVLTQAQFNFLEERFDHLPDTGTTGIFFFGFVPVLGIDQEDVFREFDPFASSLSGLNVTVTGLPSTTPPPPGAPAGPLGLAGIEPAAGGDEQSPEYLANLEPAAGGDEGQTPEELAGLEPEAGGQEAACLGDAVASAGAGQTTTLNWGGSFEDSIASLTGCQTGTF